MIMSTRAAIRVQQSGRDRIRGAVGVFEAVMRDSNEIAHEIGEQVEALEARSTALAKDLEQFTV